MTSDRVWGKNSALLKGHIVQGKKIDCAGNCEGVNKCSLVSNILHPLSSQIF